MSEELHSFNSFVFMKEESETKYKWFHGTHNKSSDYRDYLVTWRSQSESRTSHFIKMRYAGAQVAVIAITGSAES